jgi:4-amino-4-deoxy-L-arabinose transferase-like glycosyltransferase
LEGSDRFFNLVQWLAMVGSVLAASLLAQQLGRLKGSSSTLPEQRDSDRPRAQRTEALAALLVATLPIGVVESITTQNDYVVVFWLVCLANFALAAWKEPRQSWPAVGLGATLGLGLLTKATMVLYAGPWVAAMGVAWAWRLPGWRLKARPLAITGLMVLALNLPHWERNYAVFGSPMGSPAMLALVRNKNFSIAGTLSNIIRNLALETNTGITP